MILLLISVEKKRISPITTIDPMKAPSITEKKPDKVNTPVAMLPPLANITNATPRLAPELMPRMDGPASGLLNAVCSISPEAASAAPHSNAVTACGRRDSQIIKAQLVFSTSFPMRVFHTAPAGILIEPNQRFAAINTRMRTDSAMPYIYPFAFVLIISSILIVFCNTSAHSLPTVKGEIF